MAGDIKTADQVRTQKIPAWLSRHLKAEDLPKIANAVRQAESGSTGEILPVIVHHSQAYRSAKRIFWLVLLLLVTPIFMSVDHIYSLAILAVFVLFYILDMAFPSKLSGMPFLVKLLDPADVTEGVERRAALKFEMLRVQHTSRRTGVMIFISYFERRALILGDKAIAEKIKSEEWNQVLGGLLARIRAGQMSEGLESAILEMGRILKVHFPSGQEEPIDEICNELVIMDEI